MGCGMGVVKYLLFIFNFIFVLGGLAILIIGVLVHLGDKYYAKELEKFTSDLTFPSVAMIVLGSIIFVIAFFGCCGAIRESHCMIVTFASLLLTILLIEVAIAIYAFIVLKNTDYADLKHEYEKVFSKYGKDDEVTEFIDFIQESVECCGVNSSADYIKNIMPIPGSCCNKPNTETCISTDAFKNGCAGELENLFKAACGILGGIALGIAAIELVGIIFALCLANSIRNAERRGYSV